MDKFRVPLGIGTALLCVVLHMGYLYNVSQGSQQQWATKLDQPQLKFLFLGLLAVVILCAALKPNPTEPTQ